MVNSKATIATVIGRLPTRVTNDISIFKMKHCCNYLVLVLFTNKHEAESLMGQASVEMLKREKQRTKRKVKGGLGNYEIYDAELHFHLLAPGL